MSSMYYKKHGMCNSPEYKIWEAMTQRCHNPNSTAYPQYGGAGISVCWRWRNQFIDFFTDMGHRPSKSHSIDRIDGTKGYYKENCRWATIHEQLRNRKNTRWLTIDGKKMTLLDWCAYYGIHSDTVIGRIRRGYEPIMALTTPLRHTHTRKPEPIILTYNGETMNLSEWARKLNVKFDMLWRRLKVYGWSPEKTLSTPPIPNDRNRFLKKW